MLKDIKTAMLAILNGDCVLVKSTLCNYDSVYKLGQNGFERYSPLSGWKGTHLSFFNHFASAKVVPDPALNDDNDEYIPIKRSELEELKTRIAQIESNQRLVP